MTTLELPALDGRDPLGFLAALGVLRLTSEETGADVRLCFSDQSATALVEGPFESLADVTDVLRAVVDRTPDDGVLPDAVPDFPLKAGRGTDPMRVPRERLTDLYERFNGAERRWLSALMTDLAVDASGRAALTPYTAPSGKMNLRTLFGNPLVQVRADRATIDEAIHNWRRIPGVTGEYLDHRVLQSSADDVHGRKGQEAGVPAATWLAIMALPLLRVTGDGRAPMATLWRKLKGRREPLMVWPLWRQPLGTDAVRVLLEHPRIRPQIRDGRIVAERSAVRGLGVFLLCAAERQPVRGRNFAGVLAPVAVELVERIE